jgi:two-component system, NtrC family, sensor kinase
VSRRPRLTIPRRVFLAFALMLAVSGSVSVASFVQHQRTAATLSLVHEGYLPLSVTISEARATQSVFGNLLDRVLTERDTSATRSWLSAARKARPATIERAISGIAAIENMAPPSVDRGSLASVRRELRRILSMLAQGEGRYAELYAALEGGDKDGAARILADLRARERTIDGRLRAVWSTVLGRIESTSERAAAEQQRALAVLAALGLLALVVGIGVTFWSQHVLSPLPRLQERVEAVARGDLAERLGPNTDDEIGRLGREFENMVAALAARDRSLKELQQMQLQSERLAAIGRMAAHVTHEVRNPLSSIGLNVELLEEELEDAGAETKDLLRAIHREIEHLTAITEEYLRVARMPNPQLEPEDLGDIARGTAEFLRKELDAAGVRLELDVERELPLTSVDDAQIRQVLINLLKNAREAMPNGGRVRVEVAGKDGGVALRVSDDGPGMSAEQRARVFDLFYTTKAGGTGLGLPLSQQIVVAHGGAIHCDSAEGRGTVFELWFPADRGERAGSGPGAAAPAPSGERAEDAPRLAQE